MTSPNTISSFAARMTELRHRTQREARLNQALQQIVADARVDMRAAFAGGGKIPARLKEPAN